MYTNIPPLCTIINHIIHIQNQTPLGTMGYAHPGPPLDKARPCSGARFHWGAGRRAGECVSVYESMCWTSVFNCEWMKYGTSSGYLTSRQDDCMERNCYRWVVGVVKANRSAPRSWRRHTAHAAHVYKHDKHMINININTIPTSRFPLKECVCKCVCVWECPHSLSLCLVGDARQWRPPPGDGEKGEGVAHLLTTPFKRTENTVT